MAGHWTLDEIAWDQFDPAKVDPEILKAVKAASMVEFNAADYVAYLKNVFPDDPSAHDAFEQWGREETQHGRALRRWAELADPAFDFEDSFARFRAGYRPAHFDSGVAARGSRRGEMIARCVVECGTSSYYTAIKDATDEPVLKQVAGHIAADEYRHYRLFYDVMHKLEEKPLPLWRSVYVALTRMNEAEDDELAYAFYCANVRAEDTKTIPYRRKVFSRAYEGRAMRLYRRRHIEKAVQMVAKAAGLNPQGPVTKWGGWMAWNYLRLRTPKSNIAARA